MHFSLPGSVTQRVLRFLQMSHGRVVLDVPADDKGAGPVLVYSGLGLEEASSMIAGSPRFS